MSNEWLDNPSGDGWWWFMDCSGEIDPVRVVDRFAVDAFGLGQEAEALASGHFDKGKWQRVKPHGEPPKRLPKSRTVELTAQLLPASFGGWLCEVVVDRDVIDCYSHRERSDVLQWCRKEYGIEPGATDE